MKRRGPIAVNGALALALSVVVAGLAVPSPHLAPPALAEVAPQAAPDRPPTTPELKPPGAPGESGAAGPGGGVAGPAGPAGSPTPAERSVAEPAPSAVPTGSVGPATRRRRCIPNGDGTFRQTEDPQSPPCVASSASTSSSNGGATSKGVSATEIRIAVTVDDRVSRALESWVNDRFELYGRRVRFVYPTTPEAQTRAAMIASAVQVDEQLKAFGSLSAFGRGTVDDVYYDELARRHVISVGGYANLSSAAQVAAQAPYRWSYLPAYDALLARRGDLICTSLVGRPAQFAGAAQRADQRIFGLLYTTDSNGKTPAGVASLAARMKACGAPAVQQIAVPFDETIRENSTAALVTPTPFSTSVVSRLRQAGVTTVVQEVNAGFQYTLFSTAEAQLYQPEWLSSALNPSSVNWSLLPTPNQTSRMFGLEDGASLMPIATSYYAQAARAYDAGIAAGDLAANDIFYYQPLMVLAAGLQGAGPDLTPATFAAALHRLSYKHPDPKGYQQTPQVGFPAGRSWFTSDASVWWYDPTATNDYPSSIGPGPGGPCYLGGRRATRYGIGSAPSSDAGFFGACG